MPGIGAKPPSTGAAKPDEPALLTPSNEMRRTASGAHRRGSEDIRSVSLVTHNEDAKTVAFSFPEGQTVQRAVMHVSSWMSPVLFARITCVPLLRRSKILTDLCGTSLGTYWLCISVVRSES